MNALHIASRSVTSRSWWPRDDRIRRGAPGGGWRGVNGKPLPREGTWHEVLQNAALSMRRSLASARWNIVDIQLPWKDGIPEAAGSQNVTVHNVGFDLVADQRICPCCIHSPVVSCRRAVVVAESDKPPAPSGAVDTNIVSQMHQRGRFQDVDELQRQGGYLMPRVCGLAKGVEEGNKTHHCVAPNVKSSIHLLANISPTKKARTMTSSVVGCLACGPDVRADSIISMGIRVANRSA
jgi:hypothetical protein